ncbi:ribonuclease R [Allostella sp. ATCC 35155]|nr:ribonuclease R [Stella sp. ATCC 35155]
MARRRDREQVTFPDRDAIVAFIRSSPTAVGKREIARHFELGIEHRGALKALLRELEDTGTVERGPGRRLGPRDALPEVTMLVVTDIDPDGELLARPVGARGDEPGAPRIFMQPERRGTPAIAVGTRLLARLSRTAPDEYQARPIRIMEGDAGRVVGVFMTDARLRGGGFAGRIVPTDRRHKTEYRVAMTDAGGAEPGELVVGDILPRSRMGLPQAAVIDRLGDMANPRTFSLVAIHTHGIPTEFPDAAVAEAEAARPVSLDGREDLRDLPLVTIDGADARDFDDAVWAEAAADGGWNAVVAIADVAHYVRPGSALDAEARRRGNSVYFPDRVVPMLPEALSNDLCSLRPDEPRACLAVRLRIDAEGRLTGHRFVRALMRSAARLTYDQVQAAADGRPDEATGPLLEPVIRPLYGVFGALLKARAQRGTLDLDLPERQVILGPDGHIDRVVPRRRYDSHRLIEELMIAANVAAAEAATGRQMPCLYRIHDAPDPAKVEALRPVLESLGLRLARGQVLKPRHFNDIITRVEGTPHAPMVHDLVLRSQSQAQYRPENIGHFGLALRRYAHFTSPIRRYADLVVHRALIAAFGLGDGAERQETGALDALGEHLGQTERRAAVAERESVDRYTAAYLSERVGSEVSGRIAGVTRFGLFVRLEETGADGLVPVSTLPTDFYDHDEKAHALVGRRWGRVYRLGESVRVRIVEADPATGGLVLALLDPEDRWSPGIVAARASRPGPTRRTPRARKPR